MEGQSWLYGTLGFSGKMSGSRNAFVYPDLITVLLGRFEEDKLVEAHESSITWHTITRDILNLHFSPKTGPTFHFWPSTLTRVPCPWLQEDPFERKVVYSESSGMNGAGDGLFLRKDVAMDSIVSFYNGIRVAPGERPPYESISYQIYLDWMPINTNTILHPTKVSS